VLYGLRGQSLFGARATAVNTEKRVGAEGTALERSPGVGPDVRAATDLSAQGKGGMGLAADPRSVPLACNLCYTPRHLTSVNCQQAMIATRIVIYRGRIAIIDPRRSGCRIAIHDTRSDIVTSPSFRLHIFLNKKPFLGCREQCYYRHI
jgi:hypothetical protein